MIGILSGTFMVNVWVELITTLITLLGLLEAKPPEYLPLLPPIPVSMSAVALPGPIEWRLK